MASFYVKMHLETRKMCISEKSFYNIYFFLSMIVGEAVLPMGKIGHDRFGKTKTVLQRDLSRGGHHLCRLVFVCAYRPDCRGDTQWRTAMAFLDQVGCSGHWIHRRTCLYVHSVQGVCTLVPQMEGIQQNHSSPSKLLSTWP